MKEAEELFREQLTRSMKENGVSHPDTMESAGNLVRFFQEQGQVAEAHELIVKIRRAVA